MAYKTKLGQALGDLYQQWDKELTESPGGWGMFYKLIRREVPRWLQAIDENEDLQQKIKGFILEFADRIKEE